jgi:hypothetical protein
MRQVGILHNKQQAADKNSKFHCPIPDWMCFFFSLKFRVEFFVYFRKILWLTSPCSAWPGLNHLRGKQGERLAMHDEANNQHTHIHTSQKKKETCNIILASLHSLPLKCTPPTAFQPLSLFLPSWPLLHPSKTTALGPLFGYPFLRTPQRPQRRLMPLHYFQLWNSVFIFRKEPRTGWSKHF